MMHSFQPFSQLSRIHDELLRQMDRGDEPSKATPPSWVPAVDVSEEGDKLVFEVDLPGVAKEHVSVKVERRILTIEGDRKLEGETKTEFVRVERARGHFARSFRLPETVDADAIAAELRDGVLRLTLPQKKEALPRAVEIK